MNFTLTLPKSNGDYSPQFKQEALFTKPSSGKNKCEILKAKGRLIIDGNYLFRGGCIVFLGISFKPGKHYSPVLKVKVSKRMPTL
jgi:hypothetical protein